MATVHPELTDTRLVGTVVVPLDGSATAERAVPHAIAAARCFGAELVLMATRWGQDLDEPRTYLEAVAERCGHPEAEAIVIHDRTAGPAIALVARDVTAPLIVMTSHGRGGLGQAILGSVAEEVLRRAPGPVLVVGPEVPDGSPGDGVGGDLLVGIDEHPTSRLVSVTAARWARAHGVGIHLLSVLSPGEDDSLARGAQSRVATAMREPDIGGGSLRIGHEVVHDRSPARVLTRRASELGSGAIALATHGRVGVGRLTIGSVTMATVHTADRPVLVVGPTSVTAPL